jgi:transposase-like protein
MSPRTAAQMLRDAGETLRSPGAPPALVDRAALARAYAEQGWNLSQCAAAFGISATTAATIVHEAGVTVRPASRPAARVDPVELARAYENGSLTQCGIAFGLTARTAGRILRDAGVAVRSGREPRPDVDSDELAQAYQERGWSIRRCSAEFGISTAAVSRGLSEANVPRRPAGPRPVVIDPGELADAYRRQGLASCAEQFATSVYTVRRLLQAQDVPIRPVGTRASGGDAEDAQQALPAAAGGEVSQRTIDATGQKTAVRNSIGSVAAA